ncbi:Heme-dependent catalase-like protein [Glarea lozoyensis ATCC 20868]|uniref:Heme-dependent catalase-like protein n=1 Tax=Glarea lozoyensis (strain ATCC 20868 / MF5171) TaxID=1116229 RepID=S3CFS3_GLAL2|nr:Heme-dependent catalase-like protein [Glarea lozoyensis ATCC 20868]EPE24099.1 Heme-dependent catalase-like protein [Glarea lozoyensis ATCC 20868]
MPSEDNPVYTLAEGCPVGDPSASVILKGITPGSGGLSLLEDTQLLETLAHFPRERIPERVVHAKAAGAWGEFEVTHDISDVTSAAFLSEVGKKTKVLARLSTVAGEKGSSDTARDIRGFALKMFTEEGNWDFVGNDLPVFFIRDPVKFPSLNRSHKRHPQTDVPDSNMFWDFHNNNQEGVHCLMQLFGGRGVPASLRNVNGYGNHTFKFGKPGENTFKYCKIQFKPDAGVTTLTQEESVKLAGTEPDYHVKDMYNAIERGDYPTWTMYLQVMDPKDAESYRWNIFDITRIWPHKDYPLRPVGRLTLNRNPENHFQDIEQAAFSPSTLVPGIAASADIMLQARMFSYPDAARYRVGPNYQQLPCNRAQYVYSPYQRDGPMRMDGNYDGDPDYVGSSFKKMRLGPPDVAHDHWVGKVMSYSSEVTDEDFEQPRALWSLFKRNGEDENFAKNLAGHLCKAKPEVQAATVEMFNKVNNEVGEAIQKVLDEMNDKGTAGIEHDQRRPSKA